MSTIYGLRAIDTARVRSLGGPYVPEGAWLVSYDPDGRGGRGDWVWSTEAAHAFPFPGPAHAFVTWRRVSRLVPTRPDGRPNRPLTTWTIAVEPLPPSTIPPPRVAVEYSADFVRWSLPGLVDPLPPGEWFRASVIDRTTPGSVTTETENGDRVLYVFGWVPASAGGDDHGPGVWTSARGLDVEDGAGGRVVVSDGLVRLSDLSEPFVWETRADGARRGHGRLVMT